MATYRKFTLETGKEITAGKDATTNDSLVQEANPKDILLHTLAPGSPFVNVGESPTKTELKQAAIFCASKSQEWRNTKKDIVVNWFYKKDTTKDKKAKQGSWNTKHQGKLIAKKSEILNLLSKSQQD
jgi:predicted ribosome quality control (RQC) complex YloA/Tae2 family protein